LKFSKDEVKVLGHKIKDKFSMKGREPGGECSFLLLCEYVLTYEQLKRKYEGIWTVKVVFCNIAADPWLMNGKFISFMSLFF